MTTNSRADARAIYLADGDVSFRTTTRQLLVRLGYVVREFTTLDQVLDELRSRPASGAPPSGICVLACVDQDTPALSDPDSRDHLVEPKIVAALREQDVPLIYMSGHVTEMSVHATVAMALTAVEEGAVTFLAKPLDEASLANELDKAFLPGAVKAASENASIAVRTRAEVTAMQTPDRAGSPEHEAYLRRLAKLTPREREVHNCMIKGKSSKIIARDLNLSPRTVENWRRNVLSKMEAESTVSLLAETRQWSSGE